MRDRARDDGVAPGCRRRTSEVQDDHRCDAHDRAVAGGALRGLVPRRAARVAREERVHRAPEAEDAAAVGEGRGEALGDDATVLEDVLERPERELRVVGREADAAVVRVPVREVVADLAVLLAAVVRGAALGGVAEGVADREGEEGAGDAVRGLGLCRCRRIAEGGEHLGRRLGIAACDAAWEIGHGSARGTGRGQRPRTRRRARRGPRQPAALPGGDAEGLDAVDRHGVGAGGRRGCPLSALAALGYFIPTLASGCTRLSAAFITSEREGRQPLLDAELPAPPPHTLDVEVLPVEVEKHCSVGQVVRPTRDELEDEEVLRRSDG